MRLQILLLSLFWTSQSLQIPNGVYIHIPFCRRRCFYCNFPVVVVGERPSSQREQGDIYTSLVLREIEATLKNTDQPPGGLETVYFGGGTPSLLPVDCIQRLLSELKSTVGFAPNAEITLEMDPGTFDLDKLLELSAAGITRLSLGIQSFDSEVLKKCGRAHTVEDANKALKAVLFSPFKNNFSIDLISSLPGLSIDLWKETLIKAADSGCSHVSVYDLQVEDKTAFGRWYSPGVFPLPTDEQSALMYRMATEVLSSSGFEHYEVSNYARPQKRSQHNQRYWQCKPTWGFGMGAASFISNNRYTRPDRLESYTDWVKQLEQNGFESSTINKEEDELDEDNILTDTDIADNNGELIIAEGIKSLDGSVDVLEVVMLALRTSDGLDLRNLGEKYGELAVEKVLQAVQPFIPRGLVIIKENSEESIETLDQSVPIVTSKIVRLSDPDGFLLSNDIISSVFVELTC